LLQEVKAGDEGRTRALFERITSLPLPARKMKPIFKRWLSWEKVGADSKRVDHVKQRAMEFVEGGTK
jgi:rRNA biogenesis protein RRP5